MNELIPLTERQFEAIRERASAEGRSMADVIRGLVNEALGRSAAGIDEHQRRALAAIGRLGKKGPRKLSGHHDARLAEAYE